MELATPERKTPQSLIAAIERSGRRSAQRGSPSNQWILDTSRELDDADAPHKLLRFRENSMLPKNQKPAFWADNMTVDWAAATKGSPKPVLAKTLKRQMSPTAASASDDTNLSDRPAGLHNPSRDAEDDIAQILATTRDQQLTALRRRFDELVDVLLECMTAESSDPGEVKIEALFALHRDGYLSKGDVIQRSGIPEDRFYTTAREYRQRSRSH